MIVQLASVEKWPLTFRKRAGVKGFTNSAALASARYQGTNLFVPQSVLD